MYIRFIHCPLLWYHKCLFGDTLTLMSSIRMTTFSAIYAIDIRIESRLIPSLVTSIHPALNLTELYLVVRDNLVNPLPYVNLLLSLEVLCLRFMEPETWDGTDILELRWLEHLRILRITSMGVNGVVLQCPTLTDPVFDDLIQTKNNLQELDFQVQTNLGFHALVSLGMNCRRLHTCKLYGVYDLHTFWLRDDLPHRGLFPELRILQLTGIVAPEG